MMDAYLSNDTPATPRRLPYTFGVVGKSRVKTIEAIHEKTKTRTAVATMRLPLSS